MILFVVIFCEVYLGLVVARRVVYKCVCVYWRMYKFNCIWGGNVVLPRGWGGADDVRVLHQDGRDGKELLCLHAVLSACALQIVVAYKHASFPRDFAIAQLDFPRWCNVSPNVTSRRTVSPIYIYIYIRHMSKISVWSACCRVCVWGVIDWVAHMLCATHTTHAWANTRIYYFAVMPTLHPHAHSIVCISAQVFTSPQHNDEKHYKYYTIHTFSVFFLLLQTRMRPNQNPSLVLVSANIRCSNSLTSLMHCTSHPICLFFSTTTTH